MTKKKLSEASLRYDEEKIENAALKETIKTTNAREKELKEALKKALAANTQLKEQMKDSASQIQSELESQVRSLQSKLEQSALKEASALDTEDKSTIMMPIDGDVIINKYLVLLEEG